MLISKEMYEFLKDYMNRIEDGVINGKPYYRRTGLCGSTWRYATQNGINLEHELIALFKAEGLDIKYPFGEDNYRTRSKNKSQHEDPIRLKWINSHIEEYEKSLVK